MANYWVVQSKDGSGWSVRRESADQVSSTHDTQEQAITAARSLVASSGGGELIVKDRHGEIRQKDTIGKNDPFPPAG